MSVRSPENSCAYKMSPYLSEIFTVLFNKVNDTVKTIAESKITDRICSTWTDQHGHSRHQHEHRHLHTCCLLAENL